MPRALSRLHEAWWLWEGLPCIPDPLLHPAAGMLTQKETEWGGGARVELGSDWRQRETRRAAGGFEFKSSKGLNSGRWVHLCEASCHHPELTQNSYPVPILLFPICLFGLRT